MLRRRAFSTPAHIRNRECEESERAREKGERHSAYMYIIHIYKKKHIHQLGVTKKTGRIGSEDEKSVHLIWSPMVYVDIYLKVLLISVCLEK